MSRKKKHEHVNHERWLVSYADFITLLFAFFVVLFASGQSDKKKQKQVAAAVQNAFSQMGIFDPHSKQPPLSGAGDGVMSKPQVAPEFDSAASKGPESPSQEVVHQIAEKVRLGQIPHGVVTAHETREGLVISLTEAGFFHSGSAEINSSSEPVLHALATALPSTPIRVEGHTDNIPIHNSVFPTNWELSTARATNIARLLILWSSVKPVNLSAAGYAEFHPVASNETADGRTQNRRVDIIVLRGEAPSK